MKAPLILLLVIFAVFHSEIKAQLSVSGSLEDGNGSPIPYASVLLLSAADSTLVRGQITDASGRFAIATDHPGTYLVSATSVGYQKVFTEAFRLNRERSSLDLGTLVTSEAVKELGEIVIQDEKPMFEQKIDRTVVNVESNISASGGTALDILGRSPGVTVDRMNNSVALSGKQGVRIMINGKLTKMPLDAAVQMLDGMTAENIEKIELITTPPARYEAEGDAGMINIVMKKTSDAGTNGNFSIFSGYGRKEKYGGSINLNHRKRNLNIFGDYSFRRTDTKQIFDFDRTVEINSEAVNTVTDNDRIGFTRIHNGRIGLDLNVGKKTTIGGLFSTFNRRWEMDAESDIVETVETNLSTSTFMQTIELNKWRLHLANINLSHNLTENQSISIDLDHINYDSSNPTDYVQDFFDEQGNLSGNGAFRSRKDTPIKTWVAKVDYSAKVSDKVTIEGGAKGSFSHLENEIVVDELVNGSFVVDPELTSNADMNENIGAGYFLGHNQGFVYTRFAVRAEI